MGVANYCVQHIFVSSKNCVRTCFWYTLVQLSLVDVRAEVVSW